MPIRRYVAHTLAAFRSLPVRPLAAALLLGALVPLLAGCGAELYEKRLENTKKLYARMELLDAQLHRDWIDADAGIRLRLPLQFAMLAPPTAAGASLGGGNAAPGAPAHDVRQPNYMNVELPGLRGAFVARLKIIAANGAAAEEDGYIYVLTNHHLANAGDRVRGFHDEVVKLLSDSLRIGVKPEEFRQMTFPQSVGAFAQPVSYKAVTLSPKEPIHGVERQLALYMHEQGSVQTVILFVLPKDVEGIERLTDRVPLSLETLRVTGDKPTSAPAPAGSPATKGKTPGF